MSIVQSVVNDETLFHKLDALSQRWSHEREYEDFQQYQDVIEAYVVENYSDLKFVKARKKPFGFIANFNGNSYLFHIKLKGRTAVFACKPVKFQRPL